MGGKFFALTDGVQVGKVVGNEGADLDQVVGSNPSGQKRLVSVTESGVRLYNKNVDWFLVNVWAQRSTKQHFEPDGIGFRGHSYNCQEQI